MPGDTRPGPATQRRRRPPRPACLGRSLVPPERYGLTLLPRSRCDGGVQEPVRLPLEAARGWASAGHQAAALTVRGPLRTKSSVLCNRSSDLRRRSSRCVTTNLFLVVLCLPFLFIVWKSEGFLFGLIRQQRARMTRRQRALPAAAFPFVLLCLAVGFGIGYAVGGTALAGTEGAPSAGLGFAILGPMLGFTLASKLAKRRPARGLTRRSRRGHLMVLDDVLQERGLLIVWINLTDQERQEWLDYVGQANPGWEVGRMYEVANLLAEGRGVPRGWRAWLNRLRWGPIP